MASYLTCAKERWLFAKEERKEKTGEFAQWHVLWCRIGISMHTHYTAKAVAKQFVTYHSWDCIGFFPADNLMRLQHVWIKTKAKKSAAGRTVWRLFRRIEFNFMRSEANKTKAMAWVFVGVCVCVLVNAVELNQCGNFSLINFSGSNIALALSSFIPNCCLCANKSKWNHVILHLSNGTCKLFTQLFLLAVAHRRKTIHRRFFNVTVFSVFTWSSISAILSCLARWWISIGTAGPKSQNFR